MSYRDIEKAEQIKRKSVLFSKEANIAGTYGNGKIIYDYCLNNKFAFENILHTVRKEALCYFLERLIPWHKGVRLNSHLLPENHLCSSQISCINHLFYFVDKPVELKLLMNNMGYKVNNILPFEADYIIEGDNLNGKKPYIAFEWIGIKNYLGELSSGKVASDDSRKRGANFTSADFAIRFEDDNGLIRIILGEWKYTEDCKKGYIRYSKSNTDRYSKIYKSFLDDPNCPIKMVSGITHDDLFYDPFDQLMRLQLLAREMEMKNEMGADSVEVLLVTPDNNKEYLKESMSVNLKKLGSDNVAIWEQLIIPGKFKYYKSEDLLNNILSTAKDIELRKYLELRYKR